MTVAMGGFTPKDEYTAEQFADDFLTIACNAQKKGFLYVRLQALFKAGDAYRDAYTATGHFTLI